MEVPETMTAFCLHCREKREIPNPKPKLIDGIRGQRRLLEGKCPECGHVVTRFMKKSQNDGKQPPQPSPSIGGPRPFPEALVHPQTASELPSDPQPVFRVVDEPAWVGLCVRCGGDRSFVGEFLGTRFDGKKVIRGVCETCRAPQIVVGVREEGEGNDD